MAESKLSTGDDLLDGRDETTNLPHLHLSFIFTSFIPRRFIEFQNVTKTPTVVGSYAEGMRLPALVYLKQDGTFGKKHFVKDPAISFLHVKDVKIGFPSEVDADKFNYVISTDNVRAGYCRIKVIDNGTNDKQKDLQVDVKGIKYLSSAQSRKKFNSKLASNKKAIESMLDTLLNRGEGPGLDQKFSDIFTGIPESSIDLRRPFTSVGLRGTIVSARQQAKTKADEMAQTGMIDEVDQSEIAHQLAFSCQTWPPQADGWRTRKRQHGWPSESSIENIVSQGCHIIPENNSKSSQSDIEWKLSFFLAEKTLITEEMTDTQRQQFLVFYLLCLHIVSEGAITTSHLRTIFFYECENTDPRLWHKNPSKSILNLIDKLIHFVKQKSLPGYFIEEINHFDHIDDVVAAQLERRLTKLRRKPVEELFSLAGSYTILDVFPYNMDIKKTFAPVLANAKVFKSGLQAPKAVETFIIVSNAICNEFYHEYAFDHCAAVFEDVIDIFVDRVLGAKEAERQRDFLPHLLNRRNIEFSDQLPPEEVWKPITFCRFLISRFVEGNGGAGLYEHLACLYHAAANIFKADKKGLMQQADRMFKEALSREGEGHGPGLFVEYGHFLCSCEKYAEAVKYIQQAVEKESENPTSVNYYGNMESHTVDADMKREILASGGVEVLSVIYADYLLIECYTRLKKKDELVPLIQEMEHLCDRSKDRTSYELLGYCLLKTNDLDKAAGAFRCALDLDPKYKPAKENLSKCKKKSAK